MRPLEDGNCLFILVDTGVVLEDNENDVATVVTVGRLRGQASTATTQSSVGGFDSGSGRESQFSSGQAPMARRGQAPPQGLQVFLSR
jgi:hypothetical protein